MPRIMAQEIYQLCEESLPWAGIMGFEITDIGKGTCRVRLPRKDEFLRPGGTVNGPVAHVTATYSIPPERGGG
jgi:acyl-coenzyme A thioesterase PaaI-like protein